MSALNPGHYDPLEPRPPLPNHDVDPSVEHLPMEDLDFDTPPHGHLPAGTRPPYYNNQFGGPGARTSFADSTLSSAHHSANPSYAALPLDRSAGYGASPLGQYYDNPSQANLSHSAPRDYAPPDLLHEKRDMYDRAGRKSSKKKWFILGGVGLLLVAAAVGLGVYFGAVRPNQHKSGDLSSGNSSDPADSGSGGSSNNPSGSKNPIANLVVSGGTGSKIKTANGTTFTYTNTFGGTWYYDPSNPYVNRAQAQSYTPPLNTSWQWGVDKIYG
ncbi:glycoside hydrolase family 5 protein [Sphaerobolus stellatus SS14]|uniref:Glycoside hydrolase family 5 protein n=1 Tax=Sphaerobolus stellatus (strain SS14) TaxID=990650 RepID=A0A0C9VJX1_SPHS4|nr:glycoside hydrolase family 5 protein [Sphaerobolus stellatus SS14]